jgi:hypothetical protein
MVAVRTRISMAGFGVPLTMVTVASSGRLTPRLEKKDRGSRAISSPRRGWVVKFLNHPQDRRVSAELNNRLVHGKFILDVREMALQAVSPTLPSRQVRFQSF